jgi:DNA-binding XRE family transcriptional regulator
MSVAEKTRRTDVTIKIPRSLLPEIKERYGRKVRLVEPDDGSINIHASAWYKEMSATRTPGRALRVYRENRGLSQSELARKLGETHRKQYVADMEAGRRGISKEMAKKLAVILNAPVARFL